MKMLKDILTGKDNETYDNGRVLCVASFVVYFIMALASLHATPWSAVDFSAGIGAMAVGFGLNLKFKRDTEPECKI